MHYGDCRTLEGYIQTQNKKIKKLEDMLFKLGAMEEPPCFVCGYKGDGYFQPSKHKCAAKHHKLRKN